MTADTATSTAAIPKVAAIVALPAPVAIDPAIRTRLMRLAPFIRGAQVRSSRWRRAVIAAAVFAVVGVVAVAVASAVRYHATYSERMEPHRD